MNWTEEHDIILMRDTLAQDPYSYKTGSRERAQVVHPIADVLNSVQQPQFKVASISIRDHLNSLLSKFKSKTNKEHKAGGIELETTKQNFLLEKVLSAKTEYDIKFSKRNDKKKQKIKHDGNFAEAV